MRIVSYFLILVSVLFVSLPVASQKKKKKKEQTETEKKDDDEKKLSEAIEKSEKIAGLFTFYRDSTSGSLDLLVTQNMLDKEFIHFYYIENGVTEANLFKGQFRGSRIFKIEKYYNKIRFVTVNTTAYFEEDTALKKAASANMTDAVIFSTEIKAGSEKEEGFLINVDKLLLTDALGFIKNPPPAKPNPKAFDLGSLSSDKTTYKAIRPYPENMDILVDYVYENPTPKNFGSRAVIDARNITITAQHSFIAVPDNDYEPRFDDPRVGYFMTQVDDMTDRGSTPYRDLIHRWNLVKKYPDSALSEPEVPIIWWIENTTPRDIRPIIKKAALQWNLAFEQAGFKNAMQVKEQPDTATWDAGDIRYNVLRWTSSPNPPFGGYGPSFVNPRTGQILGADIMLEYIVLGGRELTSKVFETAGLNLGVEEPIKNGLDRPNCTLMESLVLNQGFGMLIKDLYNEDEEELLHDFLHFLILHEIGHTLGLNHNMRSSHLHGMGDIHDRNLTEAVGLTGSVMDYPALNLSLDRSKQGQYYTTRPGPYDIWAIEFGYKPVESSSELEEILSRSAEPALAFGNDADDMRSPGRAIDPRINVNDMTSDPVEYSEERIQLGNKVLEDLLARYKDEPGRSYSELLRSYFLVTGQQLGSMSTISRYVGGVYQDRSFVGQEGGDQPFRPVDEATQKEAMSFLGKYLFAPDAMPMQAELFAHLQKQRRGFDHYGTNEDPRLHSRYLNVQKNVLNHLLHPNVLNRIVDSELYGNTYGIDEMMSDLNNAIFRTDVSGPVNNFRQNLQIEYLKKLLGIAKDEGTKFLPAAQSMAVYNINQIKGIASRRSTDIGTTAHRQNMLRMIESAMDK